MPNRHFACQEITLKSAGERNATLGVVAHHDKSDASIEINGNPIAITIKPTIQAVGGIRCKRENKRLVSLAAIRQGHDHDAARIKLLAIVRIDREKIALRINANANSYFFDVDRPRCRVAAAVYASAKDKDAVRIGNRTSGLQLPSLIIADSNETFARLKRLNDAIAIAVKPTVLAVRGICRKRVNIRLVSLAAIRQGHNHETAGIKLLGCTNDRGETLHIDFSAANSIKRRSAHVNALPLVGLQIADDVCGFDAEAYCGAERQKIWVRVQGAGARIERKGGRELALPPGGGGYSRSRMRIAPMLG